MHGFPEQRLLGPEVLDDRGLVHPCGRGDTANGGALVSDLREHATGGRAKSGDGSADLCARPTSAAVAATSGAGSALITAHPSQFIRPMMPPNRKVDKR